MKKRQGKSVCRKMKVQKLELSSRIPRDYLWRILNKIDVDIQGSINGSLPFCKAVLRVFRSAVRNRDIKQYISDFCGESLSLPNCNVFAEEDLPANTLCALRLLTCGQKFNFSDSPYDQLQTAYESFIKYEGQCARTNKNSLFSKFADDVDDGSLSTYEAVYLVPRLRNIRAFIHHTLGDAPDLRYLEDQLRHGPGSTTDKRGDKSILIEKFVPPIGTTRLAAPAVIQSIVSNHQWMDSLLRDPENVLVGTMTACFLGCLNSPTGTISEDDQVKIWFDTGMLVETNDSRISFVDKNAKTFRTIEPQPTGLLLFQLAIDTIIRRALKRRGFDLSNQMKNRQLAGRGYTDRLATVDLSGASDCIAFVLLDLFPKDWRRLIELFRCESGVITKFNDEKIIFEKVSAMGNGYTFALETLIFAAVVYAVLEEKGLRLKDHIKDIAVYGDDIIVPIYLAHDVIVTLHHLGFSVNNDKTFTRGLVRESCGHDYFGTTRIDRPTFTDQPTEIWELVRDHNLLMAWEQRTKIPLKKTREFILSLIPANHRVFGPVNEDMIGWIHSTDISHFPELSYDYDLQGYYFKIRRAVVTHPRIEPSDQRRKRLTVFEPILRYLRPVKKFSLLTDENDFRQFGKADFSLSEKEFLRRARKSGGEVFPSFVPDTEMYPDFRLCGSKQFVPAIKADDDYYYKKGVVVVRPAVTRVFL